MKRRAIPPELDVDPAIEPPPLLLRLWQTPEESPTFAARDA
jgi:hypothetical protein